MARIFDKIIVCDLEATCWGEELSKDQKNEIIEIGICTLNLENGNISNPESILVRPIFSTCSAYCTELTSLTQEKLLEEGISYRNALRKIRETYKPKNRVWASWGDYDRVQFERNCALYSEFYFSVTSKMPGISDYKFPFGRSHINVKDLFSVIYRLRKGIGVKKALKKLNFPFIGTPHRGVDDAYNIARILQKLL